MENAITTKNIFLSMINKPLNKNFKKAFSLIELSVVVLIIGILIAGITQSSRLVRAMKLNTARSLTRSSDVNSIRNLTAWFDATAEGVFSSSCSTNTVADNVNLASTTRAFSAAANPSGNTPSSSYIMPEHRQVVRLWKDSNPQGVDADKVILEYAQGGNCATKNYSETGATGVDKGPMYHNSGLAGLPSIYFDGTPNSWFSSINPVTMPLAVGKKDFSFFTVYKTDPDYAAGTNRNIMQFSKIGTAANYDIGPSIDIGGASGGFPASPCNARAKFSWEHSVNNCNMGVAYPTNASYDTKISTEYAFGVTVDSPSNNVVPTSSDINIYQNSSSNIPITVGTSYAFDVSDTAQLAYSQLNVGGGYNAAGNTSGIYKGFISEVLIFDRKLTKEEASSVMAYLVKKYNIKSL